MNFNEPGWTWPVPIAADGRKPRISDGFHAKGDTRYRNGVGHRGQDVMYRKLLPTAPRHPWSSKWYEMFPRTPALACQRGVVVKCGLLSTGWHAVVDHDDGIVTTVHHMSELLPETRVEAVVIPGQPIGIVGGSPVGYGLVHAHFDVQVDGKFIDAEKYMRTWRYITLADAWGEVGRVC